MAADPKPAPDVPSVSPAPIPARPAAAGTPDLPPDGAGEPAPSVEALGNQIAELAAGIAAATGELLALIREFDARNGWEGFASCAEWLSWRTGLAPGAAREHVRVARALAELPLLRDALRRGAVSYSKVRAVTRVATPETEQALLDVALAGTAAHVEQIVRTWRRVDRAAEAAEDAQRHALRSLATWVDEDGMVVVRGRLAPEVGAAVRRALEAALDAERRTAGSDGAADGAADDMAPTLAQRRADALGVVAECALAGGLDKGTAGDRYQVVVHVDADTLAEDVEQGERGADGAATARPNAAAADPVAGDGTGTDAARDSEGRPAGPHVPAGTYGLRAVPPGSTDKPSPTEARGAGDGEDPARAAGPARSVAGAAKPAPAAAPVESAPTATQPAPASVLPLRSVPGASQPARAGRTVFPTAAGGQSALEEAGGIHVSAETARRLACDAATVTMRHGPAGEVLDVGRRTRTISPALRRALAARDRHCRFLGCRTTRCDSHHVRHWAHGGETALSNLVLLCRRHHRAVHEEGFRVGFDTAGEPRFVRPDGQALPEAPPPPAVTGPPLASVWARLDREDIRPGPHTATPAWRGERLDLDWAVGVLWRPRGGTPPAAGPAA